MTGTGEPRHIETPRGFAADDADSFVRRERRGLPSDPTRPGVRDARGQSAYQRSGVDSLVRVADRRRADELRGSTELVPCSLSSGYDMDDVDRWVEDKAREAARRHRDAGRRLPDREELRVVDPIWIGVAAIAAVVGPIVFAYNWTSGTQSERTQMLLLGAVLTLAGGGAVVRAIVTGGSLAAVCTPSGLLVPDVSDEPIPWSQVDYARHRLSGYGRSMHYDVRLHLVDGSTHSIYRLNGTNGRRAREFGVLVGRWRDHYGNAGATPSMSSTPAP